MTLMISKEKESNSCNYFDKGSCMIAQRRIDFGVENLLFMSVCWCVYYISVI